MRMHDFFDSLPDTIKSALLAGLLTFIRLSYEGGKWGRKSWETLLCITVTWGMAKGGSAIGMSTEASYLFAVAIGYLGTDFVKERARAAFMKKTDIDK